MSRDEAEGRDTMRGLLVSVWLMAPFWAAVAWVVTR